MQETRNNDSKKDKDKVLGFDVHVEIIPAGSLGPSVGLAMLD